MHCLLHARVYLDNINININLLLSISIRISIYCIYLQYLFVYLYISLLDEIGDSSEGCSDTAIQPLLAGRGRLLNHVSRPAL